MKIIKWLLSISYLLTFWGIWLVGGAFASGIYYSYTGTFPEKFIDVGETYDPISGFGTVLCFVLGGLFSMAATMFTGVSPFTNFFVACCGIMAYFAYVLELTYKEFCVLGNIYLQAAICLIAAIAPVLVSVRTQKNKPV